MVDAFIELQNDFKAVAEKYADSDEDLAKKADYLKNATK
jgi:putative two-component system response regulator